MIDDSIISELDEETGEWEIVEPEGREEETLDLMIEGIGKQDA